MYGIHSSNYWRLLYFPLRIFFRLLYHSFAWTYDFVARVVSLGMWQDWVYSVIPDVPGPRVLEIGHGTGWLQSALLDSGVEVYGLDKSKQMGKLALAKTRRSGHRARLVRGTCQSIPFPSGHFNQAVATFPSEYIFDPKSLAGLFRVLLPGGSLVVLPVAWITGKRWPERLAAGLFRLTGQAGEWDRAYLAPFNLAGFTCEVTRKMVKSSQVLVIRAVKPG